MAEAGAKCGTYGGYQAHVKGHTKPCGRCRRANAAWNAEYRKRGRCAPGLGWPLLPGKEAA